MLEEHSLVYKSPEWFAFRASGIGCSEIGTIMGTSKWGSTLEMYYQKIGLVEPKNITNERMFFGTLLEPTILNLWQYWDGVDFMKNYEEKKPYRKAKEIKDVVYRNSDLNFIFYTPDAIGEAGQRGLNGAYVEGEFPIECKNLDSLYYHENDKDLPPQYYDQLYGEMITLSADYGEFAFLVGGNNFNVRYVERDHARVEKILEKCWQFWYGHVVPAKKLLEENHPTTDEDVAQLKYQIAKLEPPADDTEAYREFQAARFVGQNSRMKSTPQLDQMMKDQETIFRMIKVLEEYRKHYKNCVLQYHVHNSVMFIDGDGVKSSNNKRHTIDVMEPATDKFINEQINLLSLDYGT